MRSVEERMELIERAQSLAASRDFGRLVDLLVKCPRSLVTAEPELGHYLALALSQTDRQKEADRLLNVLDVQCAHRPADRLYRRRTNLRAVSLVRQGDLQSAEMLFRLVQESAQADLDDTFEATAAMNLGVVADMQCEFDRALGSYRYALVLFQRLGDGASAAGCYHNLGMLHRQKGSYSEAEAYFEKATDNYHPRGTDEERIATALERALLLTETGTPDAGVVLAERALQKSRQLGNQRLEAECLRTLGKVTNALEDFDRAWELLIHASAMEPFGENLMLQGEISEELAVAELGRKNAESAANWLRKATIAYRRLGSPSRAQLAQRRTLETAVC